MATFEGFVIQTTARAVLFQGHYWDAPLWLPTSQVSIDDDGDMTVILKLKDWLANKKSLLEFTQYSEEQIKAMAGTA